jgi:hypothetical protein
MNAIDCITDRHRQGYLFGAGGQRVLYDTLENKFRRAARKLGHDGLHMHVIT